MEIEKEESLNIVQCFADQAPRRTWTISVTISTTSDITKLFSSTHEIETLDYSEREKSISLSRKKQHQPNKDFVLYFSSDDIFKP